MSPFVFLPHGSATEGDPVPASWPLEAPHVCDEADLVGWLDDELWTIRLDAAASGKEAPGAVGAPRLGTRVEEWDDFAAAELATACVERARELAVASLRAAGCEEAAARLEDATDGDAVRAVALSLDGEPCGGGAAFAADALALACGQRPDAWRAPQAPMAKRRRPAPTGANLAFVVAHIAGVLEAASGGQYDSAFTSERRRQTVWLLDRLGLRRENAPSG